MIKLYSNILLFLFPLIIAAQFDEQIGSKNKELKGLRDEISKLENELTGLSEEEKKNLSVLKKIDKQKLLLGKSIKELEKEEKSKEQQINSLENRISRLQKKMKSLRDEYGKYLIWMYKQGDNSTLKYLFDAESFNQALVRYKHLQYVHKENDETISDLKSTTNEYNNSIGQLEKEVEEKSRIINQKNSEQNKLLERRSQRTEILSSLKKDKENVANEIDDKRKMEIAIKQMIADLIEKERERERRLRTAKLKGEIENYENYFNYDGFEKFSELKGVLNWPVKGGSVNRGYGENKNERTNTVTLNYGIDIEAKEFREVYAVAEGIVSAIEWIPGFGSIIIITHRDNYRTVYGHLADINVLEGNKVVAGDLIGSVNESLEGNILHFEIWNERNYQNPQEWLVKK